LYISGLENTMCLAIPGKILEISETNGVRCGRVEFGGIKSPVCLDFVPEAELGDYVIVHVGFAISRVDREEAERTYEVLEAMGLLEGELPPPTGEAPERAP
jgi:hydrogenase expression/formation protein HypC